MKTSPPLSLGAQTAEATRRSSDGQVQNDASQRELARNPWDSDLQISIKSTAIVHATNVDSSTQNDGSRSPPSPLKRFVDVEWPDEEEDDFELVEQVEQDFPGCRDSAEQATNTIRNWFARQRPRVKKRKTSSPGEDRAAFGAGKMEAGSSGGGQGYEHEWQQAGPNADVQDLAGPGAHGYLHCTVSKPQKEGEGTPNQYVSYLVTTDTDFMSFQAPHCAVRRRFTDFVFLFNTLSKEYPQCAVPPLPEKHSMAYVRGDRFGPEFTGRRAYSLQRFLKRIALHPVLRRATIVALFLESSDWYSIMKSRPHRGMSGSEGSSSVLDSWTDNFLNAFSKPHKTDKRFQEVNERAKKLDDDLRTVSKTVARVAKREGDLETDYAELATQFQKLAALEPGVQDELAKFATSVQATSEGWKGLKEATDHAYLGSLNDMESYIKAVQSLLKTREQKQLDFEALTEYLNKAAQDRDNLASHVNLGASGFLRQKVEDMRGVDHEQSRRERQRKLEVQISRLTTEVETAKKTTEAFDEEVVKEVNDFERIKAIEFRDSLGGLADANISFFQNNIEIWERFVQDMERLQAETSAARAGAQAG